MDIPEPDWRIFKEIRKNMLEEFCRRILDEVMAASQGTDGSAHDRYLKVYKLIHKRDRQIADAFNDFRRSTAVYQLCIMRRMDLLGDEDLSKFSEQTQARVRGFASTWMIQTNYADT